MITNKVCFIHFRERQQGSAQLKHEGGATVAWIVDEDTGEIRIGYPAKCLETDTFVKSVGRQIAQRNLNDGIPLLRIQESEQLSWIKEGSKGFLAFPTLAPKTQQLLADTLNATATVEGVHKVMSSNWFEIVVRGYFEFYDNRLRMTSDEGKTYQSV